MQVLDDTKDHWAGRTADLSYMIAPERSIGLAAWRQGEDRAEVHQHARGLAVTVTRALGAMYPYQAPRETAPEPWYSTTSCGC